MEARRKKGGEEMLTKGKNRKKRKQQKRERKVGESKWKRKRRNRKEGERRKDKWGNSGNRQQGKVRNFSSFNVVMAF